MPQPRPATKTAAPPRGGRGVLWLVLRESGHRLRWAPLRQQARAAATTRMRPAASRSSASGPVVQYPQVPAARRAGGGEDTAAGSRRPGHAVGAAAGTRPKRRCGKEIRPDAAGRPSRSTRTSPHTAGRCPSLRGRRAGDAEGPARRPPGRPRIFSARIVRDGSSSSVPDGRRERPDSARASRAAAWQIVSAARSGSRWAVFTKVKKLRPLRPPGGQILRAPRPAVRARPVRRFLSGAEVLL